MDNDKKQYTIPSTISSNVAPYTVATGTSVPFISLLTLLNLPVTSLPLTFADIGAIEHSPD